MKKSILCIGVALLALASCGKYGYDFEDGYQSGDPDGSNPGNDTSMTYVDRSMYDKARLYPGMVGDGVERVENLTVNLPLNFRYVNTADLKVSYTPQPIFSTGLYAPAGENIKITVPAGIVGLTAQIGAHMDDLSGKDPLRREPVIYTLKELMPGDNYIRNPFGGILWIRASLSQQSEETPVQITGAVRTTDFILGESNQAEWLSRVEVNDVPWLELRGKRTIYTVPRSLVLQNKNNLRVAEVLELWDEVYEKDYYDWMGLTENNPQRRHAYPELPERGVLDIQPSAGYAHSGMPWVAQQDRHWFMMFSSYDYVMGSFNTNEGAWGTFHEVGHNYQQTRAWSWGALGETSNNLFVFKAAERYGNPMMASHPALQGAFTNALAYAESVQAKNFNILADVPENTRPFFRLTPFLQIFNAIEGRNGEPGWDFMPYVYTRSRNTNQNFSLDQAKVDFFYRALCDFTGLDYVRFFNAWGIPVSNIARREMRNTYPPMDKRVWTYNPLTGTGGDGDLPSKYDLSSSLFIYTSNADPHPSGGDGGGFAVLNDGVFASGTGQYFHTCWSGCAIIPPTLPVTIDIDMGGVEVYKGFYYGNRDHGMVNRHIRVYKSNDKTNWILLGEYHEDDGLPVTRAQRIEVELDEFHESRYFRIEFPSVNGVNTTHVALTELGLFYDN